MFGRLWAAHVVAHEVLGDGEDTPRIIRDDPGALNDPRVVRARRGAFIIWSIIGVAFLAMVVLKSYQAWQY